jgi:hypothetical protein
VRVWLDREVEKIATGFVMTACDDPGFSAYFEANIHADEV